MTKDMVEQNLHQQQQQQIGVERFEEGEKEKEKKKKRRPRRSKRHQSPNPAFSSLDRICGHTPERLGNNRSPNYVASSMGLSSSNKNEVDIHAASKEGLVRASNVAFSSLPTMHINGDGETSVLVGTPSDVEGLTVSSRSCPEPISYEKINLPSIGGEFLPKNDGCPDMMQKKYFAPHLSVEDANKAIEKGDAFRASFRVNAHNRHEAYCTVDGIPIDILISGAAAQNRAIEGDIVAVKLDPITMWPRLKGSAGRLCNSVPMNDSDVPRDPVEMVSENCKGKARMDTNCDYPVCRNVLRTSHWVYCYEEHTFSGEALQSDTGFIASSRCGSIGDHLTSNAFNGRCVHNQGKAANALDKICAVISTSPSKRPTGRVLAIIEKSSRRDAIIGFLGIKQWLCDKEGYGKEIGGQFFKKNKNAISFASEEYIQLTPNDPKFPKVMVSERSLPECIKDRMKRGDVTVGTELVAAQIDDWREESFLPQAHVTHVFGQGGEIETEMAAILFENAICSDAFCSESLACLPDVPWKLPEEELKGRKDLRNLCTFTIDPSTATDLDDALSVESVSDDIFRVGVHIADVSYFVLPDTPLDMEAQVRSTSVYLLQHKLPMLPSLLSEDLASLTPGVDRLAFSIIWDIDTTGVILNHWIGRTVIRSCCKLSYEHVQDIIDGSFNGGSPNTARNFYPELHGQFEWHDIFKSVIILLEISKSLKEKRFKDGALWLENSKLVFLFDEYGMPYDSKLCGRSQSNFLVEEFMLLANRTAAEVISRVFPDSALLRRHPGPNQRKLKEFEAFCIKHGFDLDTSSAGQLHLSLWKIREKLKNDPVLFEILISYASRPMQLALYFCTGDLRDRENDWGHYLLAVPFYTHFTSPLRRYVDIIVHRMLTAAIEAEEMYLQRQRNLPGEVRGDAILASSNEVATKCFTGFHFDKDAMQSKEGRELLSAAALKHKIHGRPVLTEVAAYCNEKNLASRHAEEAGARLYLWALLKKKETLVSDARVLGLGPKFMSIYIHKLAMERRIYYDEVEGLIVEWLETTSTLVLDLCTNKRFTKRGSPGKYGLLEEVALVVNPCDLNTEEGVLEDCNHGIEADRVGTPSVAPESRLVISKINETAPAVFPLTLQLLSTVPVVVHGVGGDCGPLDIGARLYLSSYFR